LGAFCRNSAARRPQNHWELHGYDKNQVSIDRVFGLIRNWTATHAAAHNGARLARGSLAASCRAKGSDLKPCRLKSPICHAKLEGDPRTSGRAPGSLRSRRRKRRLASNLPFGRNLGLGQDGPPAFQLFRRHFLAGQVFVELGQAFHCGRDEKLFRLLSRFELIQSRPRVYDGTLFLCRY